MDSTKHASAKDGAKADEHRSLSQKVSDLLHRGRIALFVLAGLVLAAVAVLALVTGLRTSSEKAAALKMHQLQTQASAWSSESDEAKKGELEKQLSSGLDELIAKKAKSIYTQQALAARAAIAESKKDWAAAEKDWLEVSSILPGNFLAPVALQNAAAAAEEQGASDRAKDHYLALIEGYPSSAAGIPHAWFALGRLAEEAKDYAGAVVNYERVSASWPSSDWTKLSKDRIISIKSRGLVK